MNGNLTPDTNLAPLQASQPMFAGISTEAPFGGGKGEEVFQGMLLQEYGKIVSQTGSIGISDQVRDEMIRMQARADNTISE
jgi:hypothetical protein